VSHGIVQLAYLVATILFIFALHWMNTPATARKAVYAGVVAMSIAILATWAQPEVVHHGWIILAIIAGFIVGVPLSRVPLTAVPQRTALSHAFGGLAAGLVGTAKYYLWVSEGPDNLTVFRMIAIIVEVVLGFLTFTGSLMAAGKLQEVKWIPQRPVTYPFQNVSNLGLLAAALVIGGLLTMHPAAEWAPRLFPVIIALALAFGVLLIIPIGGADMPTVIAILNSYAGLAAVAMGFVLDNKLLITAGALDGSSGLILAIIMCRAMNRSFTNVLFGAFGQTQQAKAGGDQKEYNSETIEGGAQVLEQIRDGRRSSSAQGPGALRSAEEAGRHREVCHPPGGGPDAGAHERASGRGRHPLHRSGGDGRDQPGDAAGRRGAGGGRQRRGESRRAQRQGQSDLRHAHHRRG
jgi:proton-translocating NAD(P)+ transhydrogenase subunit beta